MKLLILTILVIAGSLPAASRDAIKAACEAQMEKPKTERAFDCHMADDQNMILWVRSEQIHGSQKAMFYALLEGWQLSRSQNVITKVYLDRVYFKPSKASTLVCFSRWSVNGATATDCHDGGDVGEAKQIRNLWESRYK